MQNQIVTFGCRLNIYESEVIRDNLARSGVENAIVFNTCAVTSEAERQARQAIRKARRENPDKQIIVTGCAAQINPQKYSDMPEVDNVLGNQEKLEKASYLNLDGEKSKVNDIMELQETALHMVDSYDGKTRAFLQIQNGCNHRCTFCIIPFGRGNNRSVPVGDIISHAKQLVERGFREIVLTGVDITDYGLDLPGRPTLGNLAKRMLKMIPDLARLRLSSIDPKEVDDEVFELLANEKRFMPHLHISLQAGDDMILKRMKRRHLRADVVDFVARARSLREDVVFGADIIAGFPTETDDMFENTKNLISELGLTHLHIFPYSEREGTPAAKIPNQVPKKIRKERAAILRAEGEIQMQRLLESRVGKTEKVLIESENKGHTEQFLPVQISGYEVGEIVELEISGTHETSLRANRVSVAI
ncbi:MAG: tRNA (N(6)-L-threonylcarbamoyladenosine(37)-C(2))-methylthiotransferase MtaB [Alphaproteobacteria bacterium CG11_big_fil_rev_8_21_14_0_20_44_7]|nr:MAG: tRNA (N(6)-L-threonylcarbamoyladenosine(37)-C(2))-methylthiotransferase MtaB [Alphaproteobacteria bacterium CG11_big_fil_rev_8_21_14_0_20_44_7]